MLLEGWNPRFTLMIECFLIKLKYKSQVPQRGEIIIFYPTKMLLTQNFTEVFVKRIIGLPRERIEIKNGGVYINAILLKESYIANNDPTNVDVCTEGPAFLAKSITIPESQYLVLGDNRDNSYDGRCWGLVNRDEILGQATKIYWPFSRFGDIPMPNYSH